MKVLIPAMEKRSSLVAARSLGRQGIDVIGCSYKKDSAGFFSKYCSKKYIYNSPLLDVKKYVNDIKEIIDKEKPDLFLPINEETLLPLLSEREFFESKIKLPLPEKEILEKTFDKTESLELVKKLNIPAPKLIDANFQDINFPVIARPKYSREIRDNKIVSQKLSYIFSLNELLSFQSSDFFFQEYIPGKGYGFYALFDRGEPKAYFMLKRINEVPFTGGPSSLRESVYEEDLKEYGLKILTELRWHGLAMVEFRRDLRDGQFKFIEINPRLWGSLSLAIHSGVDFPYLLSKMAQGRKIETNFDYKLGIKSRWLFGDFSYLGSVLFGKSIGKRPSRIKACLNFLKFFGKDLYYDYFQLADLKPALVEIIFSFKKIIKKIL